MAGEKPKLQKERYQDDYKENLPQSSPQFQVYSGELPEVIVPDKYLDYHSPQIGDFYYWRSNTDNPFNSPNPGPGHKPFDIRGYRGPAIWNGERIAYYPQADPTVYENPYIPTSDELIHVVPNIKQGTYLKGKNGYPDRLIEYQPPQGMDTDLNYVFLGALAIARAGMPVIWEGVKGLGRTALKGLGLLDAESSLGALGGLTGGVEGQLAGQAVGTGINALIGGATAYDGFQQAVEGFNNGNTAQGVKGLAQAGLGLMGIRGGGVGPIISRNTDKMATVANNVGRTVNRTAGNLGQEVMPIIRQAGRMVSNVASSASRAIKNHPRALALTALPLTAVAADATKVIMDNINGINISENNGNVEDADTLYKSNGQPWLMDNQYVLRVPNPTLGDSLMNVIKEDWPLLIPAAGMAVGVSPRLWRTLSKFKRPKMYTNAAGEKVPVPTGERPAPYEPATKVPGLEVPTRPRIGISYRDLPSQPKVDPYDAFGTPEELAAAFKISEKRLNQWRKDVEAIKKAKKQERKAKQDEADEEYNKKKAEYDQELEKYNAKLEEEYNKKNKKAIDEWNAYEASKEYQAFLSKRPWYKKWDNWLMGSSALGLASGIVYKYNKNKEPGYRYVLRGNYGDQNSNVTPESENIDDSLRNATDNYIWDSYSPTQTPDSVAVPEALPNTIP